MPILKSIGNKGLRCLKKENMLGSKIIMENKMHIANLQ